MTIQSQSVPDMWNLYCTQVNPLVEPTVAYDVYHFCNDQESADALAELVKSGRKKATSSLHYWYEKEQEALPKVGAYSIITNWNGDPQCIIRNVRVYQQRFCDVTEEFALKEGEGDLSLAYWQRVHIEFFSDELQEVGESFSQDMVIVCEEFEVVYC